MSEHRPETKPKISHPGPPNSAAGCLDFVLQLIFQGMVALGAAVGTAVKGPAGLLLGVGVFVLGVALVSVVIWLRDQTHW